MDIVNHNLIEYAVAEQALESVNGDGVYISQNEKHLFVGIFDGAGHGKEANIITQTGLDFLNINKTMTLPDLMSGLHKNLSGTRGGVAIIGKLDYESLKFCFVGSGNIFLRKFGNVSKRELTQDGVIGYHIRTPQEKNIQMASGDILVLHTDGISSHFNENDYPEILRDDAKTIANNLINKFGKTNNDDATCVVIRIK